MIILTIVNKDNTKQITNMSDLVIGDQKGKKLTIDKQLEKISEIAQTIAGQNYKSHKFEVV